MMPDDYQNQLTTARIAMESAIFTGVVLPREFRSFVEQHMPGYLAKRAKYVSGQGLINSSMNPPSFLQEGETPERAIIRLLTPFPAGDVGTQIPNVYRGPLDDHEPRLPGPAQAWKI
jgi:hypothetical protein